MAEQLITKEDVCQFLAVSHKTLDRIIADGSIPFYKVRGRYRFRLSDIEKYIAGCRQQWPSAVDAPKKASSKAQHESTSDFNIPSHYFPGMKVV